MKKLYTLLAAVLITVSTFAQAPEKMSYQAVIRDGSDVLISNQMVGMQISILQTTTTGTSVYTETQSPTTNVNGLVSVEIGTGITSDDFSAIDWSAGPYFIKTETDPTGGSSYTITGTSQLLSVPYALHAKTAENVTGTITESDPEVGANATNQIPKWDGNALVGGSMYDVDGNLGIGTDLPEASLHIADLSNNATAAIFKINGRGESTDADGNAVVIIDGFRGSSGADSGILRFDLRGNDGAMISSRSGSNNSAITGASLILSTSSESIGMTERMRITNQGNVGIGNIAPIAKLDIAGNVKIADGTQGAGKVLTDVTGDGSASWQDPVLANGTEAGEMLYWDGVQWQVVPAGPANLYGMDAPTLRYCNGVPTWYDCVPPPLGGVFQGGIVFYVDSSGEHGLIAELTDASDDIWRACDTQSVSTSSSVEAGEQNNLNAEATDASNLADYQIWEAGFQLAQEEYNMSVNQFCNACVLQGTLPGDGCELDPINGGLICIGAGIVTSALPPNTYPSFTGCAATGGAMGIVGGWWLPSSGELDLMYTNLHVLGLGGFSNGIYWSSTQSTATTADQKNFSGGANASVSKNTVYKVRRIKAF